MTSAEASENQSPIDLPKSDDGRNRGIDVVGSNRRELQHRLSIAEDHRRRTAADLDNLRKRFDREVTRERIQAHESVLASLVTLLDDLERAVDKARAPGRAQPRTGVGVRSPAGATDGRPGGAGFDSFLFDVESVVRRMATTLSTFGYERFGEPGDLFDPAVHDVIGTVASADPHGGDGRPSIVAVAKPGYGSPERLLRPAAVIVAVEAG